nr:hypothetical protein CFP56_22483 [Quercus suber]
MKRTKKSFEESHRCNMHEGLERVGAMKITKQTSNRTSILFFFLLVHVHATTTCLPEDPCFAAVSADVGLRFHVVLAMLPPALQFRTNLSDPPRFFLPERGDTAANRGISKMLARRAVSKVTSYSTSSSPREAEKVSRTQLLLCRGRWHDQARRHTIKKIKEKKAAVRGRPVTCRLHHSRGTSRSTTMTSRVHITFDVFCEAAGESVVVLHRLVHSRRIVVMRWYGSVLKTNVAGTASAIASRPLAERQATISKCPPSRRESPVAGGARSYSRQMPSTDSSRCAVMYHTRNALFGDMSRP